MTLPAFLLIGAQRSGTTALHIALSRHPQIFAPQTKEPWFFSYEGHPPNLGGPSGGYYNQRIITRLDQYTQLFAPAHATQITGEASTSYLMAACAETSSANIHNRLPDVKIIALLRRPAARAYSAYTHLRGLRREPLADFRQAIVAEDARMATNWPPDFGYWRNSHYSQLLAPYLARFDPAQLRIYLYDDWVRQPQSLLLDLFTFLGVAPEVDESMLVQASPARARLRLPLSLDFQEAIKPWLPLRLRKQLRRFTHREQPPLSPELDAELTARASDEIRALETLIGRDLMHWRK